MFAIFKKRSFKKDLEKALEDGILTDEEVRYLEQRSKQLGVSQEYVNKIRTEYANKIIAPLIQKINTSCRFSSSDQEKLSKICKDLKISPQLDMKFDQYRVLWEYENGKEIMLSPITTSILLKDGEICYFKTPTTWKQNKIFRERTGSTGARVSLRVARGVRISSGRSVSTYREYEGLNEISSGDLYVTNKRLILNGNRKSTNITFGKMVDYQIYKEGIEIRKTTGKPDFFITSKADAEYIEMLLEKLN